MSRQPAPSNPPEDGDALYAGDVLPADAWAALAADPTATLVDCRTQAEWLFVGTPDLHDLGRQVVLIEWLSYPDGKIDAHFVDKLAEHGVSPDEPVYFICRSGIRSKAAAIAATSASYREAYNVAEGFEGPRGPDGKRTVSGWKIAELPWRQ
jgi:rhodanese-related sulfurtransferase